MWHFAKGLVGYVWEYEVGGIEIRSFSEHQNYKFRNVHIAPVISTLS
jgi:hypothetical protein